MRHFTNRFLWVAALLAASTASRPLLAQGGPAGGGSACCIVSTQAATAEEAKWLSFMREEEKFARDVYAQLFSKWKLRLFDNISRAEQRHYEAVGVLLTRYAVADPASGLPAGVYSDARLNALYATLMGQGLTSIQEALAVGIAIEKQDVSDLESALKETAGTDIKAVYANLMTGSLSHLESFEHVLEITQALQ
ncbi:MAG: DUF2202 domain-containing protein [Acidobacteria bacterium]|nr:DUF2202 domain-containing protein [Acidobacteriota bacterium]